MIGSLGLPEILFVLVLALLIFGPKRLPQMGRTLGKALGEFRRATNDLKRTVDNELRADLISGEDSKPATPSPAVAQTAASASVDRNAEDETKSGSETRSAGEADAEDEAG